MILAAGLLVLLGLGLFVGGVGTGVTALYWACVVACGLAAVLLVVARLRMSQEAGDFDRRASQRPSREEAGPRAPEAPSAPRTARQPGGTAEQPEAQPAPSQEPEPGPEPAGATAVRASDPSPEPEPEPAPEPLPSAERRRVEAPAAPPVTVPPAVPAGNGHPEGGVPARRGAHEPRESPADATAGEPGEEDVEVTDLLLVVDLADEVLVVDEHPRYHLAGCAFLDGREGIPLPMVEARTDGFTPCALCRPVRHLADTERSRRRAARGN